MHSFGSHTAYRLKSNEQLKILNQCSVVKVEYLPPKCSSVGGLSGRKWKYLSRV